MKSKKFVLILSNEESRASVGGKIEFLKSKSLEKTSSWLKF